MKPEPYAVGFIATIIALIVLAQAGVTGLALGWPPVLIGCAVGALYKAGRAKMGSGPTS